jgi:hypothetical protein
LRRWRRPKSGECANRSDFEVQRVDAPGIRNETDFAMPKGDEPAPGGGRSRMVLDTPDLQVVAVYPAGQAPPN